MSGFCTKVCKYLHKNGMSILVLFGPARSNTAEMMGLKTYLSGC